MASSYGPQYPCIEDGLIHTIGTKNVETMVPTIPVSKSVNNGLSGYTNASYGMQVVMAENMPDINQSDF